MTGSEDTPASAGKRAGGEGFDPTEFMRGRRPELFSDSQVINKPQLSQQHLEYYLDTLTSRKQETEFEYFCRRLAEKEICPNLRPQTGPTGGGDSKADSETLPVFSQISTLWVGSDPQAGKERWAFAFSAKKDWRKKVWSDVEGIVATTRNYKRIYFITNQFARDKARSELEDKLTKEHGVPVHILDRTWICKCIFENDRIDLAIEALGLAEISQQQKRIGHRDTERQQELQELEAEIQDPQRYEGARYQLAEDCLRAALLARGLERPRTEVDGYFARAERVAKEVNHPQQLLRIAYQRAWTAFWWYRDVNELNELYDQVENYAAGSSQADDLELILNLLQLLAANVQNGTISEQDARYQERTARLKTELERLAAEEARPNNALQARTNRLLLTLRERVQSGEVDALDEVWGEFAKVVNDCKQLGDFPLERLSNVIRALGEFVPDSEAFDKLYEHLAQVLETRRGESEGGRLLLDRGFQKLRLDKPYEAIALFGRAQERFIKREYREELVSALMGCCFAYDQVNLLWAARNNALAAAERCLAVFREDGEIIRPVLPCLQKLVWLELQLGRVPHVMELTALSDVVIPHLKLPEDRSKSFTEDRTMQDMILGLLLLRTPVAALQDVASLPDALEQLELHASKMALLYALGCIQELRGQQFAPKAESQDDVDKFFQRWLDQPAGRQVPLQPNFMEGDDIHFRSNVLGCELIVTTASDPESIYLGEGLLGAIEAFLATSLSMRIAPYREEARVIVRPSVEADSQFDVSTQERDGERVVEILHPASQGEQSLAARTDYKNALQKAIVEIICNIAVIENVDAYFDKVAGEEKAFGRSLNFSEIRILSENIFGSTPRFRITDWTEAEGNTKYPVQRTEAWHQEPQVSGTPPRSATAPEPGSGSMSDDLLTSLDTLPHRERRVLSLIDIPLWDKAGWCASVYMLDPGMDPPLVLGLGFRNSDAAKAIFSGWHRRLGNVDAENRLRISILTEVDKENPHAYNVVIGTNIPNTEDTDSPKFMLMVSRVNHMTPSSSQNLDRFRQGFEKLGRYVVAPIHINERNEPEEIVGNVVIEKSDLVIRPAWEVGEGDPDMMGIRPDDDPVIPPEIEDAPVTRLLKWRRERGDV